MVSEATTILEQARVLTFDCYGTLIDWEHGIATALDRWIAGRGRASQRSQSLLESFAVAESAIESEHPALSYPDVLRGVLRRLGDELDVEATESDCDRFATSVGEWPAFDDSRQALERLDRRYDLVVVSNIDRESIGRSIERLGARFAAIVTAEEVGAYKPDRRMFERAFEVVAELGHGREQILHCAQSLYHDHVPAKALGLATAWIDRRRSRDGWGATKPPAVAVMPDIEVGSLVELCDLAGL